MAEKETCEICGEEHFHPDLIHKVLEHMPTEDEAYDLAELFKVFGDSTRIRILLVLFEEELCVCDLAETLNMTDSAISHQLRILKQSKLVKNRRKVSNALLIKANFPEAVLCVDPACCAGVTPDLHEAALKTMESCQIKRI